jgi:hypothetical protein
MNVENTWDWKTHQPILNLMLTEFHPELVVELGMGYNSTPLFIKYNPKELICIENDEGWFKALITIFPFKENHHTFLHNTPDEKKISDLCYRENLEYYIQLRSRIEKKENTPKLLFVDNYGCLRLLSILVLGTAFDIIIHHDSQPGGSLVYTEYFDKFREDYDCYLLKTSKNWTSCLIHKQLECNPDQLYEKIMPIITDFCLDNDISVNQMYLERQ